MYSNHKLVIIVSPKCKKMEQSEDLLRASDRKQCRAGIVETPRWRVTETVRTCGLSCGFSLLAIKWIWWKSGGIRRTCRAYWFPADWLDPIPVSTQGSAAERGPHTASSFLSRPIATFPSVLYPSRNSTLSSPSTTTSRPTLLARSDSRSSPFLSCTVNAQLYAQQLYSVHDCLKILSMRVLSINARRLRLILVGHEISFFFFSSNICRRWRYSKFATIRWHAGACAHCFCLRKYDKMVQEKCLLGYDSFVRNVIVFDAVILQCRGYTSVCPSINGVSRKESSAYTGLLVTQRCLRVFDKSQLALT